MKPLCLLLALVVTTALCDERDASFEAQQRYLPRAGLSKKSGEESLRASESKYPKAEATSRAAGGQAQQPYQHAPTTARQELGNQAGDYAELQNYESFKYQQSPPQDYPQDNEDPSAYLQQADKQQQQQQYYSQEGQGSSQTSYDAQQQQQQQQLYQQEVIVGNQLQSTQQKVATQKYTDPNDDKATYYINIPMSQLLAYFQNYGQVQSRDKNVEQQITVPVYMPVLTQNQIYSPAKVAYQPEYTSAYPKHTQAVFVKSAKSSGAASVSPAATSASPTHQVASPQQHYTAPVDVLMNPAYAPDHQTHQRYQYQYVQQQQQQQPTTQYVQQQVPYENPASYADIYNTPATAYVQDNSLYEQQMPQQPQYYVPAALAEQLMAQILQQAGIHGTNDAQQLVKQEEIEPIQHDYTPPQYQAQRFRSSQEVTHLVPVSAENQGFSSKPIYSSVSSRPKTLLDSYVPSHVIAAQDAHRYRERPIKLESGFLPSKINFIRSHEKRKSD